MDLDPVTTKMLDQVLSEVGHDFMKMICITANERIACLTFSENEIGLAFADATIPFTILEHVLRAQKLGSKVDYSAFKAVRWIKDRSTAILVCHRNAKRTGG